MNVAIVAEWLRRRIGLDPLSLGANVLPHLVAQRMSALQVDEVSAYAAILADSVAEFEEVVEQLVVSETWFFRGGKLFPYLVERIRRAATYPVRILSAACSTGEEPYSLALSLVESGVPREQWRLEAIDLSARNIERARRGWFGHSSFRETPLSVRRKYFHEKADGWELDESIRNLVRFHRGNILDANSIAGAGQFDLIFIRNVLIYLCAEARALALDHIELWLSPDGVVCTGHAEPINFTNGRFQSLGPHELFLFHRRHVPERPAKRDIVSVVPRRSSTSRPASSPRVPPTSRPEVDLMLRARSEANAGALETALATCKTHLSTADASAAAYSLLGVIHRARGEKTEAETCFRKALYLDPQHEESLIHLRLLAQESGDGESAERFQDRLARLSQGGES